VSGALSYLDRQLRFAAVLPDFQDWLDWTARHSAVVEGWSRHDLGADARQWVETRGTPEADGVVPVFFHGGYWRALEAGSHRFAAAGLASVGPAQANAEYRLMPSARMADLVNDAARALAHLAGLWPRARLLPVGHSAGAHLAFWAVERAGLPQDRIAGLVGISAQLPIADGQPFGIDRDVDRTAAVTAAR